MPSTHLSQWKGKNLQKLQELRNPCCCWVLCLFTLIGEVQVSLWQVTVRPAFHVHILACGSACWNARRKKCVSMWVESSAPNDGIPSPGLSQVGFPRNATCVLNHMQHSVKMSRKGNKACVKLTIEQQELLTNLVEEHPNSFLFLKTSWTPYLCWWLLWASKVNLMRFNWFLWRQRRIKRKSSSMQAIFTLAKSCACALCPYTHPTPFGAPKSRALSDFLARRNSPARGSAAMEMGLHSCTQATFRRTEMRTWKAGLSHVLSTSAASVILSFCSHGYQTARDAKKGDSRPSN